MTMVRSGVVFMINKGVLLLRIEDFVVSTEITGAQRTTRTKMTWFGRHARADRHIWVRHEYFISTRELTSGVIFG